MASVVKYVQCVANNAHTKDNHGSWRTRFASVDTPVRLERSRLDGSLCSLPIDQHVLDVAVVLWVHVFRDLVLCQPLEVLQVERTGGQVSLTGHDARLHEESLLAVGLGLGSLVGLRFAVVANMVSGWVEADHPCVHVDTGGFSEGTFGSLFQTSLV